MKRVFAIIITLVMVLPLAACASSTAPAATQDDNATAPQNSDTAPTSQTEANSHEISLSIYNMEKEVLYSEKISFDSTNLLEIVVGIDDLNIETEENETGKNISSIMAISYLGTPNYGQYWHCYVNGTELSDDVNISDYEIEENDVIDFRYEATGDAPAFTNGEWPDNEWTKDMPKPASFTIGDIEYIPELHQLTVNISNAPHDIVTLYVEDLRTAGFNTNEKGVLEDGAPETYWSANNADASRFVEVVHADGDGTIKIIIF